MWIWGKASVEIAAPPEAVFEWLVDREKQKTWMGDEIEWLPADRSELKVGYRGREIMQTPKQPTECDIEIAEYEPPRKLVTDHEHAWFTARGRTEIAPAGPGARISVSTRIRYRRFRTWIGVLPILPFYSRSVKASLVKLKQLIEGGQ